MRNVYETDGSERAFYAAVFASWKDKNAVLTSQKERQSAIDETVICLTADANGAEEAERRVKKALRAIDAYAEGEIARVLSSGEINKENIAAAYIREIFLRKKPVRGYEQLPCVRDVADICRKIAHEIDRLKGFLRFQETTSGVYYAACAPDNDVAYDLARHFAARTDVPFVIHDVKRKYALCYDGTLKKMRAETATVQLSQNEDLFAALWKSYYRNVAIRARKNKKQQDACMPCRYRKFMNETTD